MFDTIRELEKYGPRIAGTKNDKRVTDYLVSRVRNTGLEVVIDEFPIMASEEASALLRIEKPSSKDIAAKAVIRSIPTPKGGITGPLCYAAVGREKDFSPHDFDGTVALVDAPSAHGVHQGIKLQNAARSGAAALILYGETAVDCVPSWGGPTLGTPIPAASISHYDGELLKKQLEEQNEIEVHVEINASLFESQTANISFILPGKQRTDEVVLISAHHDTVITPGANDNGSGMAVVLELATLFAEEPQKRTLMFTLFGAEEGGDIGSSTFVKHYKGDLLERIKAVINLDMFAVGGGGPCIVEKSLKAGNRWVKTTPWLNELLLEKAHELGYFMGRCSSSCGTSDEGPFLEAGIPACWVWKPDDPYYHTELDNAKRINPNDLKVVASLVGACLLDLGACRLPL